MNVGSSTKIRYLSKNTHLIVLVSKLHINKLPLIVDSDMVSDRHGEF